METITTFESWLDSSTSDSELRRALRSLCAAVQKVSHVVARAGFLDLFGLSGAVNVQGEETQKLDIISDQLMGEVLEEAGVFAALVSEEREQVTVLDANAPFLLAYDPLDGSSNLGMNVPVGTIFGVWPNTAIDASTPERAFFQDGRRLLAAGYATYGSSTILLVSLGSGVAEFTLDTERHEFVLTDADAKMPQRGKIYSVNEGNAARWDASLVEYLARLKGEDNFLTKPFSARYVGSLVADFHRTLKKGGVFMYPADRKNTRGKLRLLYECIPMAFIAEQAGGAASDGSQPILDLLPTAIHERCPLFVGSIDNVADVVDALV